MDKYVGGKIAVAKLGISLNTLRAYADEGVIEAIKTPGGARRYNIDKYLREYRNKVTDRKCIVYCRVSSHGQADDLQRQVEHMSAKYPGFEVVTDIGSGINFERKGLQQIIDYAIQGKLEKLAVAYKDRLCRIGYSLIEYILTKYSNTEIIVDTETDETVNEEIAGDLMQIITVYTAKINGMRKYKKPHL
jgi:predicted site-specific integrase-resolvase